MRALLLLPLLASTAAAAPRSWPAAGRCLPAWDEAASCVMVTARDAAAIRRAILETLDAATLGKHPDWRGARRLAEAPVSDDTIGGYYLNVYVHPSHKLDVIRLVGVEEAARGAEMGYRIDVGRTRSGGWIVLDVVPYSGSRRGPSS